MPFDFSLGDKLQKPGTVAAGKEDTSVISSGPANKFDRSGAVGHPQQKSSFLEYPPLAKCTCTSENWPTY